MNNDDSLPGGYHEIQTFRRGATTIDEVKDHLAHCDARRAKLNERVHREADGPNIPDRGRQRSNINAAHARTDRSGSRQS